MKVKSLYIYKKKMRDKPTYDFFHCFTSNIIVLNVKTFNPHNRHLIK